MLRKADMKEQRKIKRGVIMNNTLGYEDYIGEQSRELFMWSVDEWKAGNMLKAFKIKSIADSMEKKYRDSVGRGF